MSVVAAASAWPQPLHRRLKRHFLAFGLILGLVGGGLGVWGATAPIASAAIASGTVIPAGMRMVVQHLEGGIVREILVREGETVAAGTPLLVFDGTQAETRLKTAQTQLRRYEAMRQRLEALLAGRNELAFTQALLEAAANDPEFASFLATQESLFDGERLGLQGGLRVLKAQVKQYEAEIEGRNQELAGADEQLRLVGAEIDRLTPLLDQGLVQRPQLAELERLQADVRYRRAQSASLLAQARQRIAQLRLSILNNPVEFQRKVADELSGVNLQIAEVRERITAAEDVLKRTVVLAPVAGTIVDLRPNTPNAVIGAGEALLDIVPTSAELVVNARLSPIDIDTVQVGLAVQVHMLPFAARNTPPIDGRVTRVSADALIDQITGAPYYEVEIAVDQSALATLDRALLVAGMPAEVYILTGSRTFFEYVAEPILGSFRRSFRDS